MTANGAVRRIGADERRARVGVRHRLAPGLRAKSAEEVTESLVALHATDAATVYLSTAARLSEAGFADVERALYKDGSLVRLLAMRRTMFVVTQASAPVVYAAAARAIAVKERAGLLKYLADGGGWDEAWLSEVEDAVVATLAEHGETTAAQLGDYEPRLREQVVVAAGKPYEARQNVSSRIIRVLAAEGRITRRRPVGSWTSSQFRWAVAAPLPELPAAEAKAGLARDWLAAYGPGTEADLKWWTGWTLTDVRKALAAVGAEQVALDEETGYVLPGDAEPVPAAAPWAALLPGLDPTPMGWQRRDWFLPDEHRSALFDGSGNVGPTVWWDGRVVGGWAQRPDGEVVWRPLTGPGKGPGKAAVAAIEAEAARLGGWLKDIRVTPRFRTPLERELSA
ncbi:winged helix DNA-binding domain-containing protein [Streptomyces sp. H10-C2]|uniref:winged helix DNA-binding domain-containing protein n=1 Tax=unclassified Streptomyces TaxID=2593676 RepID=UPI0024B91A5B|nr:MULTISPECIES: winged helix DNA-binding domain-containing protein [unclassified Streptomyces]MDJ0342306.1 winged helix DNA-binding domain-containing protein [Streptomyces sp. PH10-H1]MDJ0372161.1 winged helix DNA-binding domain-containing protein [Streptomyces sp. H10-C2]